MGDPEKPRGRRAVATRTFRTKTGHEVVASIYQPQMLRAEEWACEFRLSGPDTEVVDRARGVDSMQALALCLQGIRKHLEPDAETLTWLDGEPGELGLPRPIPDSFGRTVERQLTTLVDGELARLVRLRPPRNQRRASSSSSRRRPTKRSR